ncbi:MEDS domain-containing protein [Alkalihalobacillus deserti]|uniref:MEDS domain-containing protein n=1 Tax=Alkalihalobacillus deserti TaxID=2879466 RepID=UPI001D142518
MHHFDNHLFYRYYSDFHIHSIIENFSEILEPFLSENINIRTWAHVEWKKQDDISSKLEEFENLADCSVNEMGLMSVCAYDSSDVSASLQTTMMRSHEYLMTDREFVRSSLYRNPRLRS